MRVHTYEKHDIHYAQIIKDNGGVLVEKCGGTPEEALRCLKSAIDAEVHRWTTAQDCLSGDSLCPSDRRLPCGPTCQSHVTHPCERCGAQWDAS